MANGPLVLAVDQGTSSTKAILVDTAGGVVARAVTPLSEQQPHPGWVEQDPAELWHSVQRAVADCVDQAGAHPDHSDRPEHPEGVSDPVGRVYRRAGRTTDQLTG